MDASDTETDLVLLIGNGPLGNCAVCEQPFAYEELILFGKGPEHLGFAGFMRTCAECLPALEHIIFRELRLPLRNGR